MPGRALLSLAPLPAAAAAAVRAATTLRVPCFAAFASPPLAAPRPRRAPSRRFATSSVRRSQVEPPTTPYFTSGSFMGASCESFSPKVAEILGRPVNKDDVELRPDGLVFLPGSCFAATLDEAFGPVEWKLEPRSEMSENEGYAGDVFVETTAYATTFSQEYALFVHRRFVAQARGQHTIWQDGKKEEENLTTGREKALEEVRLNALTRCCKDLCVASELWLPEFGRQFLARHGVMVRARNIFSGELRRVWKRRDRKVQHPYEEIS